MKNKIQQICKDLEKQNNIKIIFAVESGSRLWRIDSKNSDYDVRFVFVRPIDDYLRINKLKDVIEYNGENIDVVGFDLYKYGKLLMASNPTVIEWLLSDIVYYGKQPKELLTFIHKNFNPAAIFYHYVSKCKQNYLKYIKSKNKITYKKYLYAMRGLLNALWVKKLKGIPPINFNVSLPFSTPLSYVNLPEDSEPKSKSLWISCPFNSTWPGTPCVLPSSIVYSSKYSTVLAPGTFIFLMLSVNQCP